ncbi:hypothetical protein PIB30_062028, partial [Stylosanthes scabra]|nr:hypothetical protein [Stylosanthes scabra]
PPKHHPQPSSHLSVPPSVTPHCHGAAQSILSHHHHSLSPLFLQLRHIPTPPPSHSRPHTQNRCPLHHHHHHDLNLTASHHHSPSVSLSPPRLRESSSSQADPSFQQALLPLYIYPLPAGKHSMNTTKQPNKSSTITPEYRLRATDASFETDENAYFNK